MKQCAQNVPGLTIAMGRSDPVVNTERITVGVESGTSRNPVDQTKSCCKKVTMRITPPASPPTESRCLFFWQCTPFHRGRPGTPWASPSRYAQASFRSGSSAGYRRPLDLGSRSRHGDGHAQGHNDCDTGLLTSNCHTSSVHTLAKAYFCPAFTSK